MLCMRPPTLSELGIESTLGLFKKGKPPFDKKEMIDRVFGPEGNRGCIVISGGKGIVGAGKAIQLRMRLPDDILIVSIDMPDAPDGLEKMHSSLVKMFGPEKADNYMAGIRKLTYDGKKLPEELKDFNPVFLLEAIPEILELKRAHYKMVREEFPEIEIRSVTSGFPASELGVGVLHPAFPHNINKVWEVVEDKPSDITKLLLAIGLIPVPVGDHWSFVLDVLFCGLMNAMCNFYENSDLNFAQIDQLVKKHLGPNPGLAHDFIGPGSSFLTWSCLHHLEKKYGPLFTPAKELEKRKNGGEKWCPPEDSPVIQGELKEEEEFITMIFGPLFQMASIMLHENRASLTLMNFMGESCARFTRGILAIMRKFGRDNVISTVEKYHELHPESKESPWYPEAFGNMDSFEWLQFYVNAEHNGNVGVITISRESINMDVIDELNRAIDWLITEGITRVIITGDLHLSTQMVGADTSEFFPFMEDEEGGKELSMKWSKTARRLHDEFDISVGVIVGKRCLGGMLEMMTHCHYLFSVDSAKLGFPEVTLPVVPGMGACHWPLRKAMPTGFNELINLLLTGKSVPAKDTVGWLADFTGSIEEVMQMAWKIVSGDDHNILLRKVDESAMGDQMPIPELPAADSPLIEQGREAIIACIKASCNVPLSDALEVQSQHSARFMSSEACRKGKIGKMAGK